MVKVAVLELIDGKERDDQLMLLEALGYKHAEIGEMLGMKANTVSKAVARLKKKAEASE
jgi:DNA-directed RNA polymerase specialized sigma24 family protein